MAIFPEPAKEIIKAPFSRADRVEYDARPFREESKYMLREQDMDVAGLLLRHGALSLSQIAALTGRECRRLKDRLAALTRMGFIWRAALFDGGRRLPYIYITGDGSARLFNTSPDKPAPVRLLNLVMASQVYLKFLENGMEGKLEVRPGERKVLTITRGEKSYAVIGVRDLPGEPERAADEISNAVRLGERVIAVMSPFVRYSFPRHEMIRYVLDNNLVEMVFDKCFRKAL